MQEKLVFFLSKSCPTVSTKFVMLFEHFGAKELAFFISKRVAQFLPNFKLFDHLKTQEKLVFFISIASTKFVMLFKHFGATKTCVFHL